jgi:hypothetical protein
MVKLVDKLLNHIPKDLSFKVMLPSKGIFYKSFDAANGVRVRPMAFKDEAGILQRSNNESPIDYLLENCVQGVDPQELVSMDILAILFKIREISYGDNYKVTTKCPYCNTENVLDFKMSQLPINFVEDTITDPREILLPVTNVKAKVRTPRRSDDKNYVVSVDNLWRFVESVDDCLDKAQIAELLGDPRFPLKDIKMLINSISLSDYGMVTDAQYSCCNKECEQISTVTMNVGVDFFSIS